MSKEELLLILKEEIYSPVHPARRYEALHAQEAPAWEGNAWAETLSGRYDALVHSYELAKQMVSQAESPMSLAGSRQRLKVAAQELQDFEEANGIYPSQLTRP